MNCYSIVQFEFYMSNPLYWREQCRNSQTFVCYISACPAGNVRFCKVSMDLSDLSSDEFLFFCPGSTGRERLIRSHSSARFCFELSGNSN